ncbi:MAG: S-methyl-5'-thioadenosine phosphorylase [Anaerolineales bacterium]|jgi:5'-methylthioadenosine phosphorylase|nr:S-methyl-5'-thioadenosine phosphorylase [Anaerolineales bacterium]
MEDHPKIAVIGGSGLYEMPGLADMQEIDINTPFGKPSSPIGIGSFNGHRIAFIARHGFGHFITPTEVPYRANIFALKSLGVERVISISACGSLREDYHPGEIVIPHQLFDNTRFRKTTFFEDGFVAHVSVADPFCPDLSAQLLAAVDRSGGVVHAGGALITIEGPRFSSRIESNTFRAWGMSLINMSTAPEAFLAKEAEMCYAVMNHVTDYDVWHVSEQPVTVDMLIDTLNRNAKLAQAAVANLLLNLSETKECDCSETLASAMITQPDAIPADTRQRLSFLIDKYIN